MTFIEELEAYLKKNDFRIVPQKEYARLVRESAWLNSLESAGLDNWDGVSYAHDFFAEWYPEYNED